MKRFILLLLILMIAIVEISCGAASTVETDSSEGDVAQTMTTPPSSYLDQTEPPILTSKPIETAQNDPVEDVPSEQDHFNPDIPLGREEQKLLRDASDEFEVPYALALGLIEKETDFRNIIGDDGASMGYMQVAEKWHRGRMERLGVADLFDPGGNFRVGLDYLSELYGKYGGWDMALTVYNMGHSPGYVTDYAKEVMSNYARWQNLIENYI